MTIIIGLTGSIAMGKTATAKLFQRLDIPIYNADKAVHELYAKGGAAVSPIGKLFPEAIIDDAVSREVLIKKILDAPDAVGEIEKIVHPLVRQKQRDFIDRETEKGTTIIVLDIPLLFETGGEDRVDKVVVVTAPAELQKQRALERTGMTLEKFNLILSKQMPDAEKRAKADYIVETHQGLEHAFSQVEKIVEDLTSPKNECLS